MSVMQGKMKDKLRSKLRRNLALLAALAAFGPAALASGVSDLSLHGCWVRVLPDEAAAYFTIRNDGTQAAVLTDVEAQGYGMASLHESESVDGMVRMTDVASVIVPAHGEMAFAPGRYHVMLTAPKTQPQIGSSLPLTLHFKDGRTVTAGCALKGVDALGPH
jgi:copper(I)-binding protein